MARLNLNQLRQWQNGDIILANEYNQERNLIIEANNDTNDKSNLATLNAQSALDRANALSAVPTSVQETSIVKRIRPVMAEGQTQINIPDPGYIPNTNRIQVYNASGARVDIQETSPTLVTLVTPSSEGQTYTVDWFTELPKVIELERIYEAIEATRFKWLPPVGVESQLPYPASQGDTVTVTSSEKVYQYQEGQWVYIMDSPKLIEGGIPRVVQLVRTYTATAGQSTFENPTNFDTQTDSVIVIHNTTFVAPSEYTLTNESVKLKEPATEGDSILILAYKAMPIGTEGSVSGTVISLNTLPMNRIIGGNDLIDSVSTNRQDIALIHNTNNLQTELIAGNTSEITNVKSNVGTLSSLITSSKSNLVSAINEVATTPWTLLTYQNGFSTTDSRPLKARRVGDTLQVTGLISPATAGGAGVCATLPVGLRPASTQTVIIAGQLSVVELIVNSSGTISINAIRAGNTTPSSYSVIFNIPLT